MSHSWTPTALEWDTSFFGRAIGRLVLPEGSAPAREIASEVERSPFDCVYIEMSIADLGELASWVRCGARPVDVRIELESGTAVATRLDHGVEEISLWGPADRATGLRLARSLSRWSRFSRDPRLAARTDELYSRWIALAFDGTHGSLIVRREGSLAGLLTFRSGPDAAWIELLVVDEKYRGTGVASALIGSFLTVARSRGFSLARVRTQLRNLAALRTYERADFVLVRSTIVLHWWRDVRSLHTASG